MRKTTKKIATMAVRKSKALGLFFGGKSYRQISAELNCSVGTVHGDICAELKDLPKETREALQEQKREQYSRLLRVNWEAAMSGDYRAGLIVLKILEAERRLFGLDESDRNGTPAINLQAGQAVINILPQYADLVRPLMEAQERR